MFWSHCLNEIPFFSAESPANLYVTFKPEQNYKHVIFQRRPWYSRVKDYRQKTKCYATFNGDYQEQQEEEAGEEQNWQYEYQYQASVGGAAALLLAAAYRRRQVLAAREERAVDLHYEMHCGNLPSPQ